MNTIALYHNDKCYVEIDEGNVSFMYRNVCDDGCQFALWAKEFRERVKREADNAQTL